MHGKREASLLAKVSLFDEFGPFFPLELCHHDS